MNVLALFGISLNPLSYLGSFIDGMFSAALKLFGQSASDVVTALLGFMTTTTEPIFSGGWWSSAGEAVFVRVLGIAGGLMALMFLLSIITALLAGDPKVLMKAVLNLPLAVIQMGLLVTVTAALIAATDEASAAIASGASHGLATFVTVGMIAAITDSSVVGLVIGALIILAAISVWLQLIVRTALLYVAVLGAPLVFAAAVHPSVRGIQKRYIEFGIGLICSKVVVALAFATGAAALGSLGSSPTFSAEVGALLEALAILLIACFAPYLFVRLLIGAEALIVTEGLERRPFRAAMHAQQAGYYLRAGGGLSGLLSGMGGGGKSGGSNPNRPDPGSSAGPRTPGGEGGGGSAASPAGSRGSGGPPAGPRPTSPASPAAAKAPPAGITDARAALRSATSRGVSASSGEEGGSGSPPSRSATGAPNATAPHSTEAAFGSGPSRRSSSSAADRRESPRPNASPEVGDGSSTAPPTSDPPSRRPNSDEARGSTVGPATGTRPSTSTPTPPDEGRASASKPADATAQHAPRAAAPSAAAPPRNPRPSRPSTPGTTSSQQEARPPAASERRPISHPSEERQP
jgi:hypothetical protein